LRDLRMIYDEFHVQLSLARLLHCHSALLTNCRVHVADTYVPLPPRSIQFTHQSWIRVIT
jgi:hypothetical protein